MRTALVNEKLEKQNSCTTPTSPSPMPHFRSPSSPTPMRSPMHLKLASFKKSIKSEVSVTQASKMSTSLINFRWISSSQPSHMMFLRSKTPLLPQVNHQKKTLFEAKQVYMYKVFNVALLTDMGRPRSGRT